MTFQFQVFAAKQKEAQTNGSAPSTSSNAASPTVALRGTEIFVAVDNEIRWSDLAWLQEMEEEKYQGQAYRVLKAGIHGHIKQLALLSYCLRVLRIYNVHRCQSCS